MTFGMAGSIDAQPLPRCVDIVAPAAPHRESAADVAAVCPIATRTPCVHQICDERQRPAPRARASLVECGRAPRPAAARNRRLDAAPRAPADARRAGRPRARCRAPPCADRQPPRAAREHRRRACRKRLERRGDERRKAARHTGERIAVERARSRLRRSSTGSLKSTPANPLTWRSKKPGRGQSAMAATAGSTTTGSRFG